MPSRRRRSLTATEKAEVVLAAFRKEVQCPECGCFVKKLAERLWPRYATLYNPPARFICEDCKQHLPGPS